VCRQVLRHAKAKSERVQTAGTRAIGEFVRARGYAIWVDEDEGHLMIRRHGTEDSQRAPLSKLPVVRDVQRLTLRGRGFGDADLQAVAAWKDLEGLQVIDGQVTDAGLRQIARLTNLKRLLLWGTRTTGAGLKHLTALERLAYLEIQDTPLGDADLEALKQLPGLRVLRLLGTHATDRGGKGSGLHCRVARSRPGRAPASGALSRGGRRMKKQSEFIPVWVGTEVDRRPERARGATPRSGTDAGPPAPPCVRRGQRQRISACVGHIGQRSQTGARCSGVSFLRAPGTSACARRSRGPARATDGPT
jgi:hypothetical protein